MEDDHDYWDVAHVVYVLDQDAAREFYTESLGFEVRTDVVRGKSLDGEGAGFRWLTIGPKGQPEADIFLADCGMGHETEAAEQLRRLVAKGTFCGGVLSTGDCHATHRELSSKGVAFLQDRSTACTAWRRCFATTPGTGSASPRIGGWLHRLAAIAGCRQAAVGRHPRSCPRSLPRR